MSLPLQQAQNFRQTRRFRHSESPPGTLPLGGDTLRLDNLRRRIRKQSRYLRLAARKWRYVREYCLHPVKIYQKFEDYMTKIIPT